MTDGRRRSAVHPGLIVKRREKRVLDTGVERHSNGVRGPPKAARRAVAAATDNTRDGCAPGRDFAIPHAGVCAAAHINQLPKGLRQVVPPCPTSRAKSGTCAVP